MHLSENMSKHKLTEKTPIKSCTVSGYFDGLFPHHLLPLFNIEENVFTCGKHIEKDNLKIPFLVRKHCISVCGRLGSRLSRILNIFESKIHRVFTDVNRVYFDDDKNFCYRRKDEEKKENDPSLCIQTKVRRAVENIRTLINFINVIEKMLYEDFRSRNIIESSIDELREDSVFSVDSTFDLRPVSYNDTIPLCLAIPYNTKISNEMNIPNGIFDKIKDEAPLDVFPKVIYECQHPKSK